MAFYGSSDDSINLSREAAPGAKAHPSATSATQWRITISGVIVKTWKT
jgi:hypothetical protein